MTVTPRQPQNGSPRVVHYRSTFPVLSETFIRETVTRHQRYEPIVITHDRVKDVDVHDLRIKELSIRPLAGTVARSASLRIALCARSVARTLTDIRPDIVHAHFGEEAITASGPARHLRIPLVATFYGSDASALGEHLMWRRRFRVLFGRAAAVLAEGPHLASRLIELGANPDRVIVHPIPVRFDFFPFRPPHEPDVGSPIVVLQACRFVEKKGVDITITAFGAIADAVPDAVLWLMGSGPEEQRLRSLASRTGLGERIRFLPISSHRQYADVLRQAHIFVHPSRTARNGDGEGGAPTTLLEAQAVGLPLVSTTHADIPAIVDAEAAMLAPPEDVEAVSALLLHLIRNPQEWKARALAGRRNVETVHDPDRLALQLEHVYDEIRA